MTSPSIIRPGISPAQTPSTFWDKPLWWEHQKVPYFADAQRCPWSYPYRYLPRQEQSQDFFSAVLPKNTQGSPSAFQAESWVHGLQQLFKMTSATYPITDEANVLYEWWSAQFVYFVTVMLGAPDKTLHDLQRVRRNIIHQRNQQRILANSEGASSAMLYMCSPYAHATSGYDIDTRRKMRTHDTWRGLNGPRFGGLSARGIPHLERDDMSTRDWSADPAFWPSAHYIEKDFSDAVNVDAVDAAHRVALGHKEAVVRRHLQQAQQLAHSPLNNSGSLISFARRMLVEMNKEIGDIPSIAFNYEYWTGTRSYSASRSMCRDWRGEEHCGSQDAQAYKVLLAQNIEDALHHALSLLSSQLYTLSYSREMLDEISRIITGLEENLNTVDQDQANAALDQISEIIAQQLAAHPQQFPYHDWPMENDAVWADMHNGFGNFDEDCISCIARDQVFSLRAWSQSKLEEIVTLSRYHPVAAVPPERLLPVRRLVSCWTLNHALLARNVSHRPDLFSPRAFPPRDVMSRALNIAWPDQGSLDEMGCGDSDKIMRAVCSVLPNERRHPGITQQMRQHFSIRCLPSSPPPLKKKTAKAPPALSPRRVLHSPPPSSRADALPWSPPPLPPVNCPAVTPEHRLRIVSPPPLAPKTFPLLHSMLLRFSSLWNVLLVGGVAVLVGGGIIGKRAFDRFPRAWNAARLIQYRWLRCKRLLNLKRVTRQVHDVAATIIQRAFRIWVIVKRCREAGIPFHFVSLRDLSQLPASAHVREPSNRSEGNRGPIMAAEFRPSQIVDGQPPHLEGVDPATVPEGLVRLSVLVSPDQPPRFLPPGAEIPPEMAGINQMNASLEMTVEIMSRVSIISNSASRIQKVWRSHRAPPTAPVHEAHLGEEGFSASPS